MKFRLYFFRLKCLFRNKESMFWCYLFPILLATCFNFAFNNLWKLEDFKTIDIAYISETKQQDELKEILDTAKTAGDVKMFEVSLCDLSEAQKRLKEGEIEAYIIGSSNPVLTVSKSGMNETIIKSFLDSYRRMSATVTTVMAENPNALEEGLINDIMNYESYVQTEPNNKKPASILIYFYSLMAYACVFAANWGLEEVVNIQANLSDRGARVSVSPINKMRLYLCNMLAAFTAHIGSVVLLFLYMFYFIKIDFGNNLIYLFFACFVGSLAGLGIGSVIGVWIRKKAEVKEAILTFVILGGGFLSGMMFSSIKYYIAENIPFLAYINPVNLLTDAMYSLYYYDTYDRYFANVLYLGFISILLGVASYIGIRRKSYASI